MGREARKREAGLQDGRDRSRLSGKSEAWPEGSGEKDRDRNGGR